jgi:hypothetical protein
MSDFCHVYVRVITSLQGDSPVPRGGVQRCHGCHAAASHSPHALRAPPASQLRGTLRALPLCCLRPVPEQKMYTSYVLPKIRLKHLLVVQIQSFLRNLLP